MIDVNVYYGNWPFQDFGVKSIAAMEKHLSGNGITKALIYSADAVFAADPATADEKLAHKLKNRKNFMHVPTVNPLYKNWMEIVKKSPVKAVIVYPNYHKYSLLSTDNCELAEFLSQENILYTVSMRIDDERSHHPACIVPGVKTQEVLEFAERFPELKILCLGAYYGEFETLLNSSKNIFLDTSFAETDCTMKKLSESFPPERILFGSHAPFFYTAANVNKLKYAEISSSVHEKIAGENAINLIDELK